jgi:hypothetical protein
MGFRMLIFKIEITAGRPVIIQLEGHTMLGMGYNDDGTNTIFVHNAWDYNEHSMVWGGAYNGMAQEAVTVIQLSGSGQSSINKFRNNLIKP